MSETCTTFLKRLPPDITLLGELVRQAIDQTGSPTRGYTLSQAVSVAEKLLQDLERAEGAAEVEP